MKNLNIILIRKTVKWDKIKSFCENNFTDMKLYTENYDTDFIKMLNYAKRIVDVKSNEPVLNIARDIYNHSPELSRYWTFAAFASEFMEKCVSFYILECDTGEV